MIKDENKGLQLCYLLLNENGFNSLKFRDKDNKIIKQYTRFPRQRLLSFIKNNQDVDFEEWELNVKLQKNKGNIKITGDKDSGILVSYKSTFGKTSTDYVSCGEFVYCPTIISLFKRKQLAQRIENTLYLEGKLYV